MKTAVALCLGLLAASPAPQPAPVAGYTVTIGGVKVSYTKPGCNAYYDLIDDTLTIEITDDDGALTVTAGSFAAQNWGGHTDIYIVADATILKSITLKGRADILFYVMGQVAYCPKFTSTYTNVGSPYFAPAPDGVVMGLGSHWLSPPATAISMKYGECAAPLFGVDYSPYDLDGKWTGESFYVKPR